MTGMRPVCTCASLLQTGLSPGPRLGNALLSIALQVAVLAGKGGIHRLSSLCRTQQPHPIQLPLAADVVLLGAQLGLNTRTA